MTNEYTIRHFLFMAKVAIRLDEVPASVLEHHYDHEMFGCWWLSFKLVGRQMRVAFDGKDGVLTLDRAITRGAGNWVAGWKTVGSNQILHATPDKLLGEIIDMVSKHK